MGGGTPIKFNLGVPDDNLGIQMAPILCLGIELALNLLHMIS